MRQKFDVVTLKWDFGNGILVHGIWAGSKGSMSRRQTCLGSWSNREHANVWLLLIKTVYIM